MGGGELTCRRPHRERGALAPGRARRDVTPDAALALPDCAGNCSMNLGYGLALVRGLANGQTQSSGAHSDSGATLLLCHFSRGGRERQGCSRGPRRAVHAGGARSRPQCWAAGTCPWRPASAQTPATAAAAATRTSSRRPTTWRCLSRCVCGGGTRPEGARFARAGLSSSLSTACAKAPAAFQRGWR